MKREGYYGMGLAALAAFILYWLNKKGLLHESVSASIITPNGTVQSQAGTGLPQYDVRDSRTIPDGEDFAVNPISSMGVVTQHPSDPNKASCPQGYTLYHEVSTDSYLCIPDSAATLSSKPDTSIPISSVRLNASRSF